MIRSFMVGASTMLWAVAWSALMSVTVHGGLSGERARQASNNRHSAISPDGSTIAFESDRDENLEIYVMNVDGSNIRRLTNNPADDMNPNWSRDGSQIVFSSHRDSRRPPGPFYTMNPDGAEQTRLPDGYPSEFFSRWSEDGSKVVFWDDKDGNSEVYIKNADGTGEQRLTFDPAHDSDASLSPDGSTVVYESFVGNTSTAGIYVVNVNGSDRVRLADGTDPQWSPDGSRILYKARDQSGACCDIYVMHSDGTAKLKLSQGYMHRWLPDGSRIVFFSTVAGTDQIYIMDPDGSNKEQLTK